MSRKSAILVVGMIMLDLAAATAAASAQLAQQVAPPQFTPFRTFMQQSQNARAADHVGQPGKQVRDAAAFEEMRQHILRMYTDMPVVSSYVHGAHTFDCVPVMQQPSVRLRGIRQIAAPPPTPSGPQAGRPDTTRPQVAPGLNFDAHGNLIGCTSGNVPIRRLTLEEMTRFETLAHFFQKGPNGAGQAKAGGGQEKKSDGSNNPPPCSPDSNGACHAHAYAYEWVTNYGASTTLELWNPVVADPEGFSLSQLWVVNTTGLKGTQTLESGWEVNPQHYPYTSNAVLFVFATPDGYQSGCRNLDCPGFVQTDNTVHLGGDFTSYSTIVDGVKYPQTITLTWQLFQGYWWLLYGSTWVGYYPPEFYNIRTGWVTIPGPLATYADLIEFGGETVGGYILFVPIWPAMGSGYYGTDPNLAAQQNTIYDFTDPTGSWVWSSLTPALDTPATCYNSAVSGTTLSFGGPGGRQFC